MKTEKKKLFVKTQLLEYRQNDRKKKSQIFDTKYLGKFKKIFDTKYFN